MAEFGVYLDFWSRIGFSLDFYSDYSSRVVAGVLGNLLSLPAGLEQCGGALGVSFHSVFGLAVRGGFNLPK